MKVSLDDIQSAFFGDDVPRKNITLRKAHDEIARLRAALTDVTNPLEYLRRHAEADGNKLNGMAYSIANDLPFVQKIAKDAIEVTGTPPETRDGRLHEWSNGGVCRDCGCSFADLSRVDPCPGPTPSHLPKMRGIAPVENQDSGEKE